jgi:hypothetical protein
MRLIETIKNILLEQEGPPPNEWEAKQAEIMHYINLLSNLDYKNITMFDINTDGSTGDISVGSEKDEPAELKNIDFKFLFSYDIRGAYDEIEVDIQPEFLIIQDFTNYPEKTKTIYYGTDFTNLTYGAGSPVEEMISKYVYDEYLNREP